MKKLLVIVGIVAAVAIIGAVATSFFLGGIVTAGVNRIAPKLTGTKVVLAGASISPLSGSGTLNGLVVGNPTGWSENNLCSLGKIHLDLAPFSILGDHIVIHQILIDAPEFNYETKFVASNVNDLLKNIEQSLGGGKDAPAKDGKPIKFAVSKLMLTNGKVRLGVGGSGMSVPMPDITLTDLGTKEGGITADQLVFAVMKSVTGSVVSATAKAAGDIAKTGGATAAEGVKQMGGAIKNLFGGEKKQP